MNEKTKDIPLPLALVLLGIVVGGLFYLKYPQEVAQLLNECDRYGDSHLIFLWLLFAAICINCLWAYTILSKRLGITQQGKRLEILTGLRRNPEPLRLAMIFKIGSVVLAVSLLVITGPWFDLLPTFLPMTWRGPLCMGVSLNFGLCGGIVGSYFAKGKWHFSWRKQDELPPMPTVINGIVLGTIGENENGLG